MPPELALAHASWVAASDDIDLLDIDADDIDGVNRICDMLFGRPRDRSIGEPLDQFIRCTYYPREVCDDEGTKVWQRLFRADVPERIDASSVIACGAWFRRDLAPDRFLPGQAMDPALLPAIRLVARYDLPFRTELVARFRADGGGIDAVRFERWAENEVGLAYYTGWDLPAPLRAAFPDIFYFLFGFRIQVGEEAS